MTRADICASDDAESLDRLQGVLSELAWVADDTWHDTPLGVGLTRFRRGSDELSVFRDAWTVDVAGSEDDIRELLAALTG